MTRNGTESVFEISITLSSGTNVGEKICLQRDILGRRRENRANRSLARSRVEDNHQRTQKEQENTLKTAKRIKACAH